MMQATLAGSLFKASVIGAIAVDLFPTVPSNVKVAITNAFIVAAIGFSIKKLDEATREFRQWRKRLGKMLDEHEEDHQRVGAMWQKFLDHIKRDRAIKD